MTETSNKFFKINGNRTVDTFAPGVDIAIFQPVSKRQNKKFRALYVGRWSKDKGTELFSNLFYNIPSIDWTIVGMEGQEEIKFPSNVRRLGILDPKSLAKEMGRSDILIFYGKWDTFGLVAIEALSCGVPVLAYADCEIARLIEFGKCGLSFRTMEELVSLIHMLKNDRTQLKELAYNARSVAEDMTWDKSIETFLKKLHI